MTSVTALIRHSDLWNDQNCFVNYKIDVVVFTDNCNYDELVSMITSQLGVDTVRKTISIKYTVEGDFQPMEIHNDMGVRVYVELKRENGVFGMYPMCVSIDDFDVEDDATSNCIIRDDVLQIGYSENRDCMDVCNSTGKAVVLFENDNNLVISNPEPKGVFVDQIYQDKETLKIVMTKYTIRERFNFKTESSNAISYTLVCWSPECKSKFRASRIGDSEMFRVRFFDDEHTCPLKDKVYSQRQATSWFIGETVVKAKITNHKMKATPGDIIDDVKNEFGVDASYMMAWRAREKAIKDFRGDLADSYKKLPAYIC